MKRYRTAGWTMIVLVTRPTPKGGGFSEREAPSYLPGVRRNYWDSTTPDTWWQRTIR